PPLSAAAPVRRGRLAGTQDRARFLRVPQGRDATNGAGRGRGQAMSGDAPAVLVEGDGPIAVITINRPGVLNALDERTLRELQDAIVRLVGAPALRCAILTGAGERAFVAGADIAAMAGLGPR